MSNTINSLPTKLVMVDWEDLSFIQPEGFKHITERDMEKLKQNLKNNDWSVPFIVWEDSDNTVYCLDGYHRIKALKELIADGYHVPDKLPAVFIELESKKDAAKMVLSLSAHYATIKAEILGDFFKDFDILRDDITKELNLVVNSEMIGDIPLENLDILDEYKEYYEQSGNDIKGELTIEKAKVEDMQAPDTLESKESVPRIETSRIRMMAVYLNQEDFQEATEIIDALKKHYNTDSFAEAFMALLREWRDK